MEIQFIRKLMTSHMVVLAHADMLSEWEEKMISHASIKGVLFADYICEDGQCNLWYDITGKNSLDVLLGEKTLDYELLCRIFVELYEAVEGLDDLLLRGENLLLTPETIFWDYRGQEIYFCYCPGAPEAVEERFVSLVEYLLKQLDHTDERAVEMAYDIYNHATGSGWSLRELKQLVCLPYEIEEARENGVEEESLIEELGVREDECEVGQEDAVVQRQVYSIWKKMKWDKYVEHFVDEVRQRVSGFWKILLNKNKKVSNREDEQFVFEPEEENEEGVVRPTVLLANLTCPLEGILHYEGNGGCQDIVLDKAEIVIGSDANCDGWISSATVSRRHAKITRKEDVYFLEDLNSTNGTYVGGQLLNYKTKVSLQKNEIVIFADEKFRFI